MLFSSSHLSLLMLCYDLSVIFLEMFWIQPGATLMTSVPYQVESMLSFLSHFEHFEDRRSQIRNL